MFSFLQIILALSDHYHYFLRYRFLLVILVSHFVKSDVFFQSNIISNLIIDS